MKRNISGQLSSQTFVAKSKDQQLALLDYRTTHLEDIDLFPAQLLLGRRPGNTLPAASSLLVSKSSSNTSVKNILILPK